MKSYGMYVSLGPSPSVNIPMSDIKAGTLLSGIVDGQKESSHQNASHTQK